MHFIVHISKRLIRKAKFNYLIHVTGPTNIKNIDCTNYFEALQWHFCFQITTICLNWKKMHLELVLSTSISVLNRHQKLSLSLEDKKSSPACLGVNSTLWDFVLFFLGKFFQWRWIFAHFLKIVPFAHLKAGGSVEETFVYKFSPYSKFEFSLLWFL